MLKKKGFPHKDMKARVQSAWSSVELYDVLIVIFDVHRHLARLVVISSSLIIEYRVLKYETWSPQAYNFS